MTHPELHKLITAGLYELNWFENAWTKTLGRLGRTVTSPNLRINLRKESANSQEHINRISKIFCSIGEPVGNMQTKEFTRLITDFTNACCQAGERDITCDTAVVSAVMKAAAHQVEAYSSVLKLTNEMQNKYVYDLLTDSLAEVQQTNLQMMKLLS